MKKKCIFHIRNGVFLVLFILVFFVNCNDNDSSGAVYDPTRPIVCNEFLPDSGGVGTKLVIRGENFGNDTSLVRVTINGKKATVVGVNDTRIYAVVPRRADIGPVTVTIGKEAEAKSFTFEKNFEYRFSQMVSTLAGYTDNDGNSERVNGTLEEARFMDPRTIKIDKDGDLYVVENNRGLRVVSINRNDVTSPFSASGSMSNPVMLDFSPKQDTLYITNEVGNDTGVGLFTVTRENGFMNARELLKQREASDVAVNPVDGTVFIAAKPGGSVYRYNPATGSTEFATSLGNNNFISMLFSPDGKTLYLMGADTHVIYKSTYNFQTKGIENLAVFAGTQFSAGHADGVGTAAQFHLPFQAVLDDEGNLYVAELSNHTIRKITPDGVVSTYAGIPGERGYLDGKPEDAKFNEPMGLAIDEEGTIYVADTKNHRIRMIKYD